jgi:hypothetical protein
VSIATYLPETDIPSSTTHCAVAYKPTATGAKFFGVSLTCKEKKTIMRLNVIKNN